MCIFIDLLSSLRLGLPPLVAVDHSIVMYLIGPSGEFVDFYTQLMTAPEIAERMEKSIRKIAPPPETGLLSFFGLGK